jgi:hypothetical protein
VGLHAEGGLLPPSSCGRSTCVSMGSTLILGYGGSQEVGQVMRSVESLPAHLVRAKRPRVRRRRRDKRLVTRHRPRSHQLPGTRHRQHGDLEQPPCALQACLCSCQFVEMTLTPGLRGALSQYACTPATTVSSVTRLAASLGEPRSLSDCTVATRATLPTLVRSRSSDSGDVVQVF